MKPPDLPARQLQVRRDAARRWQESAPKRSEAAANLARGGTAAAASDERQRRYVARESLRAMREGRYLGLGNERIIGDTVDLDDTAPTLTARSAGAPVARIVELLDRNRCGDGFATGFLVAPGLLMTNWHVFGTANEAMGCGAQFGYEKNAMGLVDPGCVFELDPTFFFTDEKLDVTLVGVKTAPCVGAGALGSFKFTPFIPGVGKILVGHPVNIIQHPDGRVKHWAVRQNTLTREPEDADAFLSYTTDTLPGSSGAPAFNVHWELVAVHHSGVPRMEGGNIKLRDGNNWRDGIPDSEIDWVANEGARVSKIHALLRGVRMPDAERQRRLDEFLASATDPLLDPPGPPGREGRGVPDLRSERGREMSIVVNGNATFYMGPQAPAPANAPAPIPVPANALVGAQEKKLRFDAKYSKRPGFDSDFLDGFEIELPKGPKDEILQKDGKPLVLKYHHYSLAMHEDRRLCMWAASNANYDENTRRKDRKGFGEDTWKPDPRIAIENQIEDAELYGPAALFDRGHIVRRDDVAWGETAEEEEFGNSDSFHWTNCTPQHERFNRDAFGYHGLWGGLENHIAKQAGFVQNRVSIFAGPILDKNDPEKDFGTEYTTRVPVAFWKVVLVVEDAQGGKQLRSYGFILDQSEAIAEYGWEGKFRAEKFKEQQVSLSEITERSRVEFPDAVLEADTMKKKPGVESKGRTLRSYDDIKLR